MKRTLRTGIFASTAMLILILDTKTAIIGAQDGIQLCIRTVIPSLLPFFVLTSLLTGSMTGMHSRILRPVERLCRMSSGSGVLLITGLLGGYPAGAQGVADAYRRGQISKENAHRLLGFCSNAGPAFIFGILAGQFSSPAAPWLLWGIHIFSCVAVAALFPGNFQKETVRLSRQEVTLIKAVERSGKNMAKVCLWIILFRVLIAFLDRWFLWYFDPEAGVLLSGLLELTIGCTELACISQEGLRFVICSAALGFGGICVAMQTGSVAADLGLASYIKGKTMQSLFSMILALVVQYFLLTGTDRVAISFVHSTVLIGISALFFVFLRKNKNNDSNLAAIGV